MLYYHSVNYVLIIIYYYNHVTCHRLSSLMNHYLFSPPNNSEDGST